jgi:hypothetical protein
MAAIVSATAAAKQTRSELSIISDMQPPAARAAQQVAATIRFACPYCGGDNEVPSTLAGCVATCAHCSRDMTTPMQTAEEGERPLDAMLVRPRVAMLAVPIAACLGAIMGWLMLFVPVWSSMLNPVGLGAGYASVAGLIGALSGAFFAGLMAYWVWPEPPISGTQRVSRPMVVLSIAISACLGALLGSLLLLVPASYYMLSTIWIGARHVGIAGVLGTLLGAFLGGLLGYCMCRE